MIILFVIAGATNASYAQIIDRMMAVIGNHIITLSDVEQERRIREVLGEKGSNNDKSILNDLINSFLVQAEIGQSAAIDVSDADIDSAMRQISDLHGIAPGVIRDAIRRRVRASQFFDARFRQAIRPTNDEIQQYYQAVFVPAAQKQGTNPIPALEQVSQMIAQNIVEEKMVREVDSWLEETRQRSDVEIFP
jgi:hypothetical protein